jgi:hypothetical protein
MITVDWGTQRAVSNVHSDTVPLLKSKVFICRSCPILVLATILSRPRRADVKNSVKNYQGPTTTTSCENVIRNFPHTFF